MRCIASFVIIRNLPVPLCLAMKSHEYCMLMGMIRACKRRDQRDETESASFSQHLGRCYAFSVDEEIDTLGEQVCNDHILTGVTMAETPFPALLVEFLDGPAWDIIEELELDLEYHPEWFEDWKPYWGLNKEGNSMLWSFAMEGAGGEVCLWTYEGQDLDVAPVVHLDSEGEVSMLAGNLGEFLMLTTFGFDPFTDPEELDEQCHEEGRAFLVARGVEVPESVSVAIERAIAAHPDFEEWIDEHLKT